MRKMISLVWILAVLLFSCACDKEDDGGTNIPEPEVEKYTNPVFNPVFADPTVLDNRERDGYFYAYGTQDNWGFEPEGERLVPVLRSKDLVNWEDIGNAFTSMLNWNGVTNLFWAPDIQYVDGKYYLYYSLSIWGGEETSAIGVALSDTPAGPFTDLGKILDKENSGVTNCIDSNVFTDDDGKEYIVWGSFHGIYMAALKTDHKTAKLNEKIQIAGNAFEASYIFKREGYYYFMGSVGACCGENVSYHVTVARSESLNGPYLDINGNDIMDAMDWNYGDNDIKNVNSLYRNRAFVGPGHNSEIVKDDNGDDWIFYHAISVSEYTLPNGNAKRPMMLDKVVWENGWPMIGVSGTPSSFATEVPVFNE
ncbi:MAG: family 43 glycosylhydrolase [Bacteroidota bacterium]